MQRHPSILVTNDDGIDAPGLEALERSLGELGTTMTVAPDRQRSGVSHALTLEHPLRLTALSERRFHVDGTPTDCVHLALSRLYDSAPDLLASGINRGLNVGDDVTYSGTVAAALEGTLLGIPSVAFSLDLDGGHPERVSSRDYAEAADWARRVCGVVLERGLPPGILLNVNVPKGEIRGTRVTRQGTRSYRATTAERSDPSGRPYFWIDELAMVPAGEGDGDHRAIEDGFVSLTPLKVNWTDEASLESLRDWSWDEA